MPSHSISIRLWISLQSHYQFQTIGRYSLVLPHTAIHNSSIQLNHSFLEQHILIDSGLSFIISLISGTRRTRKCNMNSMIILVEFWKDGTHPLYVLKIFGSEKAKMSITLESWIKNTTMVKLIRCRSMLITFLWQTGIPSVSRCSTAVMQVSILFFQHIHQITNKWTVMVQAAYYTGGM